MIVKEFLAQCLTPLEVHSRPLWDFQSGDDQLRPRSQDLPTEELNRVVAILLGGDLGDLPEALVPLYRLDDRAGLIAALPAYDERELLPAERCGPIEVSSDDTSGGGTRRRPSTTARRVRLPRHRPSFCASSKMMMSPGKSPR
ncbi:hypothetical protein ZWY2020_010696 [Hordeum vulgare]|nr:hypothetical protein ZWY2020_010696 [Hordeum vulgare]